MRWRGDALRAAALLLLCVGYAAAQELSVLCTTRDLADLAARVGGKAVRAEALSNGTQDPHRVLAKPSTLLKVRRADVLIEMGLDLEHAWLPALLESAHNERIQPGQPGFINASAGLVPLEVPATADRSRGTDVHPRGNPHYNVDPEGGRLMARNIAAGLSALRPEQKAEFAENLRSFEADLDAKLKEWAPALAKLRGAKFVTRHGWYVYLAQRAGFTVLADLEPEPGLEPGPTHVAAVMELIRREKPAALLVPPWKQDGITARVAQNTGVKVLALPMGSTGDGQNATWLEWMDHVIRSMAATVLEKPAQ
jgi:zinc/manganese transport system substrate-binding protein